MQISECYAESKKMIPQVLNELRIARDKLFSMVEGFEASADRGVIPQVILDARSQIDSANQLICDLPIGITEDKSDTASESDVSSEY